MKVYVVDVDDNGIDFPDAVFSTREKAVKYIMEEYGRSCDMDVLVTQKPTKARNLFKFTWESEDDETRNYTICITSMKIDGKAR